MRRAETERKVGMPYYYSFVQETMPRKTEIDKIIIVYSTRIVRVLTEVIRALTRYCNILLHTYLSIKCALQTASDALSL